MKKLTIGLVCMLLLVALGSSCFASLIGEYTLDDIETCYPLPETDLYRVYSRGIQCDMYEPELTEYITQAIDDGWVPLYRTDRSLHATLDDRFLSITSRANHSDAALMTVYIKYRKTCDLSHLPGTIEVEEVQRRVNEHLVDIRKYVKRYNDSLDIDYIIEVGTREVFDAMGIQVFRMQIGGAEGVPFHCIVVGNTFIPITDLGGYVLIDVDQDGEDEFVIFAYSHLSGNTDLCMSVYKPRITSSEGISTDDEIYTAYRGYWRLGYGRDVDTVTLVSVDGVAHFFEAAYMDGILVPISEDYGEAIPSADNNIWGTEAFPLYWMPE